MITASNRPDVCRVVVFPSGWCVVFQIIPQLDMIALY
jgi:hypothetical protein